MILFCIDIDATISDASLRIASAGPEPSRTEKSAYERWVEKINAGMEYDKPVKGMKEFVTALAASYSVVYLTSREETHRRTTESWLHLHGFPDLGLIMRPVGNYQEGSDFKETAILFAKQTTRALDVVVCDDDEKGTIEKMCKRFGYTFLKARSGGTLQYPPASSKP